VTPIEIVRAYVQIAGFWDGDKFNQENGVEAHRRAIRMASKGGNTLVIGCGCSGRFFELLKKSGYEPEAVDNSREMVKRAKVRHPDIEVACADLLEWETEKRDASISAWDSIWHLNIEGQIQTIEKMSGPLAPEGVVIFTAGGVEHPEERVSPCMDQDLFYGALG
jgi:trans-aconitate methyltransferase